MQSADTCCALCRRALPERTGRSLATAPAAAGGGSFGRGAAPPS